MVWRNTTKWLLDLKHQQDTIIFGLVARANEESCKWNTRVNGDPTVCVLVPILSLSFSCSDLTYR